MILTYQQCIEKYGSDYNIKKMIKNGELYQMEKGIYSDNQFCSMFDIIIAKYPQAVFSGRSAYYYHGLTDEIPKKYYISTKRSATRIKDDKSSNLLSAMTYMILVLRQLNIRVQLYIYTVKSACWLI